MDNPITDILDDVSDELENLTIETPNAGGAIEELNDEIAPLIEDLAEKLAELSDASAEITAQIVEAAKTEKITAKLDEERGDIFQEIEDEINDELPTGRMGAVMLTLLFFGGVVLLAQKFKRRMFDDVQPIDNHIVVKSSITTDNHGMVYNG